MLKAIAAFFGVSVTYFDLDDAPPVVHADTPLPEDLRRALRVPGVAELAVRASEASPEQRAMLLLLLEQSCVLAQRWRIGTPRGILPRGATGELTEPAREE